MDNSHIALISLYLRASGFQAYRSDKPLTLGKAAMRIEGVNMLSLAKVMRLAGSDDSITLQSLESTDKLTVVFENPKQGKKTDFAMNLIALDRDLLTISNNDYQAKLVMNSGEFTRLCRDLYQVAETVKIEALGDSVIFSVEGDMGKGNVSLSETLGDKPEDKTSIDVKQEICLSFGLRYLNMFNKASSCAPLVTLRLSNEAPLIVDYTMDKFGSLRFYLAPKINDLKEE